MDQFCPKCGASIDTPLGPKGLCKDCYRKRHDLVDLPDEIRFDQCSQCNDYKIENTWNEFTGTQDMIFDLLKPHEDESVEMSASYQTKGETYIVNVMMIDEIDGKQVEQTQRVKLVPEKTQCPTCARFQGGYYEAIVQLRGTISEAQFGELMDAAADLTNKDKNHFISNVEQRDGGYDVYVSSQAMANRIIDQLKDHANVDIKRSRERIGEKDGEPVFRNVISARVS